jgi:membrane-bound ClpP family serine protease
MEFWVWAVLLMGLGAVLAVLEVFFPSAGLFGLLSAVSIIAAIIMGFYAGPVVGVVMIVVAGGGLPTLLILAFKFWPRTAMGRRMMLNAPTSEDVLPSNPNKDQLKNLIGRTGRAKSKLLLSGVVVIDGRNVDAVSESMPVEVGQMVRVIRTESSRVVVRPIEDDASASPPIDPLQQVYDDPFELPRNPPA